MNDHESGLCAGLIGACPDCRQVWLTALGDQAEPGLCMVCDTKHWPWDPHGKPQHTGEITVRIFPVGVPHQVRYEIHSTGPVQLQPQEMYYALRSAASIMREQARGSR